MSYTGFILNSITLGVNICAGLSTLLILGRVFYHFYFNRIKQDDKITIFCSVNTYLLLFIYTGLQISFNIRTLLGDLYEENFNSLWCICMGYLIPVIFSALYWSFTTQAFFRLCRIVYSNYRWLQHFRSYAIIYLVNFILVCILLSPILFLHDIVYLPKEYYCMVPITNLRGFLWVSVNTYGISIFIFSCLYLRITIFLRQQPNNQTYIVRQRQQRDLLVIRRISIIASLLLTLGTPAFVLILMYYITGKEHPLLPRILWFSVSLSLLGLSLALVMLTPQLKNIILRKFQQNRVVAFHGSLAGPVTRRHNISTI